MLRHDPIKRQPWKSFADSDVKAKISKKGVTHEVTAQRDILGVLAAQSQQNDEAVDIDGALCFSLAPVPLGLATCDGTRRKTTKSALYDAALQSLEVPDVNFQLLPAVRKYYNMDKSKKTIMRADGETTMILIWHRKK